jgi:hypothetical protein
VISRRRDSHANADSRKPVIGNAGCYVTFESDATNLGLNATGRKGDNNGVPDTYLYTAVRRITLVQSVRSKAIPLQGGGHNPSMSWYANYVVFDSKAPFQNQFRLENWQFRTLRSAQYQDPVPPQQPPPGAKPPADTSQIYMRYLGPV